MYFVYVLQSERDGRTYVGYSSNFEQRLHDHNLGRVIATKNRIPMRLIFAEEKETLKAAKARELWWKSPSGRNELKRLFKEGLFEN